MADAHEKPAARETIGSPPVRETLDPLPVPAGQRPLPESFGRYRILKPLGKGGMGTVYLAEDTQLGRPVALKVPHFGATDLHALPRFYREARLAASIDHPNLCPVYDVGDIDDIPYLTMAYVEGRTLTAWLGGGKRLPQRQVALLGRKLADALAAAHRRGIIHRDLKPSNIMINQRHEPVVMDFGLARRFQAEDARLTRVGAIVGTPAYMPPEQVAADTDAASPACDVYSLGVILYELLTGRLPFEGPVAAVLGQILYQEPERPTALRPDLAPALEAICLKAMAKKVEDRYASMTELRDALSAYLRGSGPTEATAEAAPGPLLTVPSLLPVPATQTEPSRPPAARRRWPWFAVGAAAVFLATVALVLSVTAGSEATLQIELDDSTVLVSIDGRPLTTQELSAAVTLPAGDHALQVTRGGKEVESQTFTLRRGENRVLVLKVAARAAAPPDRPVRREPVRREPVGAAGPASGPGAPPMPQPERTIPPPRRVPDLRGQPVPPAPGKLGPDPVTRQTPEVLKPREFATAVVRARVPALRFEKDAAGRIGKVWVVKTGPGMVGGDPLRIELIPFNQAVNRVLATEVLPLRLALVEASFPYKEQVEEFRRKLRLPSHDAVLSERIQEADRTRPSFQFRGLEVERMTLPGAGPERWEPLDLESWYRPLVLLANEQFEEEDPALRPIFPVSHGLVMRLPRQFKTGRYPKLAAGLPSLRSTRQKLARMDPQLVLAASSLAASDAERFGCFYPLDNSRGEGLGPPFPRPSLGPRGGPPTLPETPIDHCLVRFFDATVKPGKAYRYRFKVKMANPNYSPARDDRKNTLSPRPDDRKELLPAIARDKELTSDWAEVPMTVTVPADEFVYAVDQKNVKPMLKGIQYVGPSIGQETVFQIHRWVDTLRLDPRTKQEVAVGAWLVAARFVVGRGEFVRTPPDCKVEVPVKNLWNQGHALASRPGVRGREQHLIPVAFGDESVLVDFEGGWSSFLRAEGKAEKAKPVRIVDRAATEVLIQRPDGTLIARNDAADETDPVRTRRYAAVLERLREIKAGDKPVPGPKMFGPGSGLDK